MNRFGAHLAGPLLKRPGDDDAGDGDSDRDQVANNDVLAAGFRRFALTGTQAGFVIGVDGRLRVPFAPEFVDLVLDPVLVLESMTGDDIRRESTRIERKRDSCDKESGRFF